MAYFDLSGVPFLIPNARRKGQHMDVFTQQYIVTALWSSTGDDEEPLDDKYGPEDMAPEALQKMTADCKRFQAENEAMVSADPSRAGHDFWLTRNGHGAGFWDGDWLEHGDTLTERCKAYDEVNLYVGDDGLIYIL